MTKIYQIQPFGNKSLFSQMLAKTILIMKLSFIFILLSVNVVFASSSYAQFTLLSLDMTNKQVSEVLDEIERLSEFRFFYNSKLVYTDRKVTVIAQETNVYDILNQLFASTNIGYKVIDKDVILLNRNEIISAPGIFVTSQMSQAITITGTITEANGETLPGVSIMVKNTQIGITSDANGRFSINVPNSNAILVFSYIGFETQEIPVGSQTQINVTMLEATQQIEEVVVVGYGTQRRETLTGAVASINSSEITATKSDNLVANMQGKLPGLLYRPNSGEPGDFQMSLSIRGYGSPVIVIDGIVRNRGGAEELAQINSEDIESVSILKDASAAIYGMNAANGVIIVTTKKGTNEKVRFSYSGMTGSKRPVGLPEMMNVVDYYNMANEMARNQILEPRYSQDIINKYKEGEFPYVDNDWMDLYFYKWTPMSQSHNISARGGSDRLSFFTGVGYSDDKGMLKTDAQWYRRFTIRNNLTALLTDNLKMNVMISGRFDQRQATRSDFFDAYKEVMTIDRGVGPFTEHGYISVCPPEEYNPAAMADPDITGYRRWHNTNVTTQMDFTYTAPFLPGLNFNLAGSFDIRTANYSQLQKSYDAYDYLTETYVKTILANSYQNTMDLYNKGYTKFQANYNYVSGGHNLTVMAAIEASQERYDNLSGRRTYEEIYTSDILNMASAANQTNSGSRSFRRYAAMIGRVNYDFQGKYLVEVMLRRDGSYRYAPGKRWVLFPSASLGWRISEEDFFKKNVHFVNNLKLRASYGESGRDQGSAWQYISAYSTNSNNNNYIFSDGVYTVGYRAPGVVNDKLSWVTAKFYNVGIDVDYMRNKLSTTIEFFQRYNTGLLAARNTTVPNTFGASFPDENINSDMNTGLELSFKYKDKIGAVRYSIGANITYARTKRLHVERTAFTSQWDRWRNGNENRYTGRSLLYDWDGQYTSFSQFETAPLYGGNQGNTRMQPGSVNIVDVNGDGRISGEDQLYIGWGYGETGYLSGGADWGETRYIPPLQYGFPIEVNYKSFDLNMIWTGSSLFSVNIPKGDVWGYGSFPAMHVRFFDRWHVEPTGTDSNGNAIYPDLMDPATVWTRGKYSPLRSSDSGTQDSATTDRWRPDGTYLRLKSIELGYNIPRNIVNKIGLNGVRFYVNGFNVLTFAGSKLVRDYDPEKHEGSWNVGLSNPSMKSWNLGVNLTF